MNQDAVNRMPVRQASLGKSQDEPRRDVNMGGFMSIARVIKVHHKNNTVDLMGLRGSNPIAGSSDNEGRYAARLLTSNAKHDDDTKKSWGVVEPIQEGELVLVGFVDGYKQQPIVFGSLHRMDEEVMNMLNPEYPILKTNQREYAQYIRVFPRQDYIRVDGLGNVEWAHHQKTFLKMDTETLDDSRYGTDYHNLYMKDKVTGDTINYNESGVDSPIDLLFVQRDNWDNSQTKWTKVYLKKNGMFRFTRDNRENNLFYIEVSPEGAFKARRQLDSFVHASGSNFTEIKTTKDGEVELNRTNGGNVSKVNLAVNGTVTISAKESRVVITPEGQITVYAKDTINMSADSNISITAKGNMDISANGVMNVKSSGAMNISSSDSVKVTAPAIDLN